MQNRHPATVSDHVEWAFARLEKSDAFFGHGCDNAQDEAIWATLHVAGLMDRDYDDVSDLELTSEQSSDLRKLIHNRIDSRKPLAYLIREAWFAGLSFHIDERAIVPRSHFGDLIQDGFVSWIRLESARRILDLCAGSGCIAVAMALRCPDATVDATDIDADALDVARINVDRYAVDDRVRLIQSDLFESVESEKYDLIVCNPPYVSSFDTDSLPAEYHKEPRHALEADDDGLEIVKKILSEAAGHLTENGHLLIELGESAGLLESRNPTVPFFWLTSRSGESVVLLLSAEQLKEHGECFR